LFRFRQDFLERSYSQKLAAQRERDAAEAAAAARAQEAAKLQQQWEQQTYAKRASLAAACGVRSSAAAPSHGGRGPYDSPPVMVRTEQPSMGARTRVRGWSGYSSADSLVSLFLLCSLCMCALFTPVATPISSSSSLTVVCLQQVLATAAHL
jgi:hypothetical protein